MKTVVEKLEDLEYDELITLAVIETSEDLLDIFTDEIKMPFNILYRLQKANELNDKTKELLLTIFEKVILTKEEFIEKYKKYSATGIPTPKEEDVVEIENDKIITLPTTTKKKKAVRVSKVTNKEVPRRYGKAEIMKDIQNQGGVSTYHQRFMLRVNDLKNIQVNLGAKGIRDIFGGAEEVSEEYYRQVDSAIRTLERLTNVGNNSKNKKK